jgi:hypothetical protein
MQCNLLCTAVLIRGSSQAHATPYNFNPVLTGGRSVFATGLDDAGTNVRGSGNAGSQTHQIRPGNGSLMIVPDVAGIAAGFTAVSPLPADNTVMLVFRGTLHGEPEGTCTIGTRGPRTIAHTTGPFSGPRPSPSLPALNDSGPAAFSAESITGEAGYPSATAVRRHARHDFGWNPQQHFRCAGRAALSSRWLALRNQRGFRRANGRALCPQWQAEGCRLRRQVVHRGIVTSPKAHSDRDQAGPLPWS